MLFIGRAEHLPLLSREYLLAPWNGHLMPGSFAVVRLLDQLWPVSYVPVAIVDLSLQLVAGVLAYRLLVALFGARAAILVPLSMFLFSPVTLPAFLWWAAALNQLPGQVAMIGVLLLQVRYHRLGRTRDGVAGAMVLATGLLFSEKLLLVLPVVFALTLLFLSSGRPPARVRYAVRSSWRVWLAHLAVVVPYCVYYLSHVPSPVTRTPKGEVVLRTAWTALTKAVLPGLLGGPWRWQQVGVGAIADPVEAVVVVSTVAAGLLVVVSVLRRRRAVFGWAVVAGYWLSTALLLGVTRAPYVGPVIGAEYRYSTEVCIVVAVFGTAAFLPLHGPFRRGQAQRLAPRRRGRRPMAASRQPLAAGALCVAVVGASLVSTYQFDRFWRQNQAASYFARARSDLATAHRPLTLVEMPLPPKVQQGFLGSFVHTSTVMSAFEPRPRFLTAGRSADELYMPDDTGHLRRVAVEGFPNRKGRSHGCGWRVERQPVSIPLTRPTLPWRWTARVGYLASEDATATVRVGSVTSMVRIRRGVNTLFVLGEGVVDSVDLTGLSRGALCTDDVTVGSPRAVPYSHP
ncbi:hypothetical protein [Pedococcus sp. 5OH_020]|uniref:hypothetical protein n=1 Tax=Pedococcus sp. 5OH_020 TaxID=2989814 RepID=UPI0022E9E3BC|nr:hypothetical protein [Pedococcus sp. 5OH_020]